MGQAIKAHPAVILLAISCGGILAGVPGAFLAVPLVAVISAVGGYYRERRAVGDDAAETAGKRPRVVDDAAEPRKSVPRNRVTPIRAEPHRAGARNA